MEAHLQAALVTVVEVNGSAPRHSGSRMLVYDDGSIVGTIGGGAIEHLVIQAAIDAIITGRPTTIHPHLTRDLGMCCGGGMTVFIEPLCETPNLFIFGAGHVALQVAPIAHALQFKITIIDDRPDLNHEARFPFAIRVTSDPREYALELRAEAPSYALIVTHDHALDQDLITSLLPKPLEWIGMIGSEAKVAKFLLRLRASGFEETDLAHLCAPVGLRLGAETPAEIAVSIAAELVRVRRHSRAAPLPLSETPIAARGGTGAATPRSWTLQKPSSNESSHEK